MRYLDIETTGQYKEWDLVPDRLKELFKKKFGHKYHGFDGYTYEQMNSAWRGEAAFHAEFGKIVCIVVGKIHGNKIQLKQLTSMDEKALLNAFKNLIQTTKEVEGKPATIVTPLCAHNGKEFDFPFLTRRMLINRIELPVVLDTYGVKTWDYQLEDTIEYWSGTQWKYKASLDLLCECMGIDSPKTDMTGADVWDEFHGIDPNDVMSVTYGLDKISRYCCGDVVACAKLHRLLMQKEAPTEIEFVTGK